MKPKDASSDRFIGEENSFVFLDEEDNPMENETEEPPIVPPPTVKKSPFKARQKSLEERLKRFWESRR